MMVRCELWRKNWVVPLHSVTCGPVTRTGPSSSEQVMERNEIDDVTRSVSRHNF
jgi:hypothetical protein